MKIHPRNPFSAVIETGGATFEPGLGWWTQAGDEAQLRLGRPFASRRDAIYIPTLQKSGEPVDAGIVEYLKGRARELGLTELTQAAGIWVLSETGEIQAETVWIAYAGNGAASQGVCREKLSELAAVIKNAANQDAVAWEEDGELKFTDFIPGTVKGAVPSPVQCADPNRIWIVPQADLETVECRELLLAYGEQVLVTRQGWGARWGALEDGIVDVVEKRRKDNPSLDIFGVKLEGDSPEGWNAKNIHRYSGEGLCPLEAVAEILQVELGEYRKLATINLKGRVAGLREAGTPQGVIDAIRLADRCAQGVTPDDEADAVRAWGKRVVAGDLTIVRMRECKCAPVTDRFYGQYQNILILGEDGEANFYGRADICTALGETFVGLNGWMRIMEGAAESFWGAYTSAQDQQDIERFLRERLA